ncbi:MAG: hypothetical protein LBQ97_02505 [Fusobacteriaceae bacterium]|jgi:predicted transcriptional regulator|nr:hypothetical protein [Fusobacteriaceae bacterium]
MRNKILMSIRPEFAEAIYRREKLVEYRPRIPKGWLENWETEKTVYIYETAPVSKVTGKIIVKTCALFVFPKGKHSEIITYPMSPAEDDYLKGHTSIYALHIRNAQKFKFPMELGQGIFSHIKKAPQSWVYVETEEEKKWITTIK